MANVMDYYCDQLIPGLPTPRDACYLSDIRTVKIATHSCNLGVHGGLTMFKVELRNSASMAILLDRTFHYSQSPSEFSHNGFLDILENIEAGSVETLCFHHYPLVQDDWLQTVDELITQALCRFWDIKTLVLAECNIVFPIGDPALSLCCTIGTLVISYRHSKHSFMMML